MLKDFFVFRYELVTEPVGSETTTGCLVLQKNLSGPRVLYLSTVLVDDERRVVIRDPDFENRGEYFFLSSQDPSLVSEGSVLSVYSRRGAELRSRLDEPSLELEISSISRVSPKEYNSAVVSYRAADRKHTLRQMKVTRDERDGILNAKTARDRRYSLYSSRPLLEDFLEARKEED